MKYEGGCFYSLILSLPSATLLLKLRLPETIQSLYRLMFSLENFIEPWMFWHRTDKLFIAKMLQMSATASMTVKASNAPVCEIISWMLRNRWQTEQLKNISGFQVGIQATTSGWNAILDAPAKELRLCRQHLQSNHCSYFIVISLKSYVLGCILLESVVIWVSNKTG